VLPGTRQLIIRRHAQDKSIMPRRAAAGLSKKPYGALRMRRQAFSLKVRFGRRRELLLHRSRIGAFVVIGREHRQRGRCLADI
jgi:hypothetical protein